MEDELKPVAMYIVTHYIWNAVRHEMKKRLLVIDEAWWMMKSEDTALLPSILSPSADVVLSGRRTHHAGC